MILKPLPPKGSKVAVALSGGVDSAVAACLLKEQGYDLTSITLKVGKELLGQSDCLGDAATLDAVKVCQTLGIKHYVLDVSRLFERAILDYFTQEYMTLRTPNPCIRCNELIKWGYILKKVHALGIEYLATGHYTRIVQDATGCFLAMAKDITKDQSYVLWRLNTKQIARTIFPLGEYTKAEVRGMAERFRLHVAGKKDSQDFCMKERPDLPSRRLKVLFRDGRHLAEYDYRHPLTIGQRGGMGIAFGKPFYVMRIDGEAQSLYLTDDKEDLLCHTLRAGRANWFGSVLEEGLPVYAKIRSTGRGYKAHLYKLDEVTMKVEFTDMPYAAALGQSVVCYMDEVLVAGGVIEGVNEDG